MNKKISLTKAIARLEQKKRSVKLIPGALIKYYPQISQIIKRQG